MEKEKKAEKKITLYMLLGVNEKATDVEIRKAYKKMIYIVHPDKNPNDENATEKFRNLQMAYKILMDPEKRALYDETGEYDENDTEKIEINETYEYFRTIYKRITTNDIENYSKKYKNSEEEKMDLIDFYIDFNGDIELILENIPLSENKDIERFINFYEKIIKEGVIERNELYEKSKNNIKLLKDESKEADEELEKLKQQIVLNQEKRNKNKDNFYNNLLKKYGKNNEEEFNDIDDEEFEKIQKSLLNNKKKKNNNVNSKKKKK